MNLAYERSPKALAWVVAYPLVAVLYFALLEAILGATIGKAICGLRVVGPNKNPPGFFPALLRALLFVVVPNLPTWLVFSLVYGAHPKAYLDASSPIQAIVGFSFYVVLALLFCTVRRRNGFAAVHDLVTRTRLISRTALESRPLLAAVEMPSPAIDAKPAVGPYHVLETLETNARGQWLLGYDLRLLRKVWIRTVPPDTPPVPASLRNIGRVGRLRWLTGRRSPEENWDAFEAVSGKPLSRLVSERQPWSQVRFWLYDLAREISAAEKDGTLPQVLALDRVWITGDGRAKLLDFAAPGLPTAGLQQVGAAPTTPPLSEAGRAQRFLSEVAVVALEGRVDAAAKTAGEAAVPLPLHARNLLKSLPQLSDADIVASTLKPLLQRVTKVSRWRRAAVVAGCMAFPACVCFCSFLGPTMIRQSNPGILELSYLLQLRQANVWATGKPSGADPILRSGDEKTPGDEDKTITDRQIAVFIAGRYRATITDDAAWNNAIALSLIKGESRRFAEQSVADHPAPTVEEIAAAEAALKPYLLKSETLESVFALSGDRDAGNLCLPSGIDRRTAVPRWAGAAHCGRDFRPAGRPAGLSFTRVLAGPCGVESDTAHSARLRTESVPAGPRLR